MDAETDTHRQVAVSVGENLHGYIGVADAKAGAIAAASAALLLLLADATASESGPPTPFLLAAGFSLLLAFLGALVSVYPRRPSSGRSLVFWNDIGQSHQSPDSYVTAFTAHTPAQLVDELLSQNFWLSRVLATKFAFIRASLWLLGIGVVLTVVAVGAG